MTRERSPTRQPVAHHVARVHHVSRALLIVAFRVFIFCVFLPLALAEFTHGESVAGLILLIIGLGLGGIMAPHDNDV